MYRSQINSIIDMLEDCGSRADYRDLRRIVNRYIAECGKEFMPKKPKKYPWHGQGYSDLMVEAGDKLKAALDNGNCPYYNPSEPARKIPLIKAKMLCVTSTNICHAITRTRRRWLLAI